jgi:type IV pilus assembly protein PilB
MVAALAAEARIVNAMLDARVLSRSALREAEYESQASGEPLVEILIRRDHIGEADVARAYSDMYGLRFLDLTRRQPSVGWVLSLPENAARRAGCLVFGEVSGELVVVVADPDDPAAKAALTARFDRPAQFVVSPRYQIFETLDHIYGDARRKGQRMVDAAPLATAVATTSATGLNAMEELDSIIDEAVDRRASDVHLEAEEHRLRVRFRIDGRMIEARSYPTEVAAPLISRVKVLATLDLNERRKPQDGRFDKTSFDQKIDFRVAVIPCIHGERVTLRLLAAHRSNTDLESLGMELEVRQAFERMIRRPHGIILITGPTGSGKSTTMYAALQMINSVDKHIITIEDPVEYHVPGINQVQVNRDFGVSFAAALRSIVRHDPDVIMVGEIRDEETAHLALEASLTGHLVFATLHTNSAVGSLTRLLDMGCEPYLVSSAILCVMAQRLVRRICSHCKKGYEPTRAERNLLGIPQERTKAEIFRGAGCARCGRSGYYDRVGIYEFVPFDAGLTDMVMGKASTEAMQQYAVEHGAVTLRSDAIAKVLHGWTTLEEALRVTTADTFGA